MARHASFYEVGMPLLCLVHGIAVGSCLQDFTLHRSLSKLRAAVLTLKFPTTKGAPLNRLLPHSGLETSCFQPFSVENLSEERLAARLKSFPFCKVKSLGPLLGPIVCIVSQDG